MVYPPEMVEFFRALKPAAPAPASAALAPTATTTPPASPGPGLARRAPPNEKSMLLAVLPFGTGQFQNGHDTKGWFFAAFDGAALAFAAVNLYRTESLKTSGGFLTGGKYASDADRKTAEQSMNLYVAGFAVCGALWAYGAVDGLTHFDDTPPVAVLPVPGGFAVMGVLP